MAFSEEVGKYLGHFVKKNEIVLQLSIQSILNRTLLKFRCHFLSSLK